ncbi:hypothetical protein ACNHKD_03645 [Methylocystis sp. JAN1]|uniref:hypothetical protein n=1 Tax=Methylocystis sp. JAN1 TaxID=3397211 RepID=UPI003FA25618
MQVVFPIIAALAGLCLASATALAEKSALHFASNGNFDRANRFAPERIGFTLADVGSLAQLERLRGDARALVWLGGCRGVSPEFKAKALSFNGKPSLWGFYLVDDAYSRTCDPATLKAESNWIHENLPGAKVFVSLANSGSFDAPSYRGYTPATTGADFLGIAAYPCRTELNQGKGGCDLDAIDRVVKAALDAGIPVAAIIPTFQAFGEGNWTNDGGGRYVTPSAEQEIEILERWCSLIPSPAFDHAYSWGTQRGDRSLENSVELQAVFLKRNSSPEPCRANLKAARPGN